MATSEADVGIGRETYEEKWGFHDEIEPQFITKPGLSAEVVKEISAIKGEPDWMLQFRLKSLRIFERKKMPQWGANLNDIDFEKIRYYVRYTDGAAKDWDMVPDDIKDTYEKLGIPEAERKFLAGVEAQYDSEVVYHKVREDLEEQGVIFTDTDTALKEHPDLFREYFSKIIPPADNKFAALNSAVWSGGSFIYIPPGVHVELPLQAYFRINAANVGQFERTLIIADEGSFVHYIEGCTAPVYTTDALHSAVVELVAKKGAHLRYTTIQNWSGNVYNLVTKRALAYADAKVVWLDGNLGSKVTMKYPGVYLMEPGAQGEVLSVALAGKGQHQDAGAKMVHAAPHTSSVITSKSISREGGRSTYRGLVKVHEGCHDVKSNVRCDALLMDEESRTDTYPYIEIDEDDVTIGHEAAVSKIGDEQLFYMMSRGLSENKAVSMIVNGFFDDFTKELPMEYAVELRRLIELQLEGSVG